MTRCLIRVVLVALSTACATTSSADTDDEGPIRPTDRCPPPGTPVPFAKLMNPAFAADYAGCDVATTAEFIAPGQIQNYMFGFIPVATMAGRVPFQVVAPGLSPGEGGGLGGDVPPHVFVSKAASDLVFTLVKGDAILLRGAPVIGKSAPLPGGQQVVQVILVASRIEKAQ